MLEMIKNRLSRRLYSRLECGLRWNGLICPKIQKKLEKLKEFLDNYYAKIDSGIQVRVEGPGGPFVVDTKSRTCSCCRWDLTGIPCPHAIVVLHAEFKSIEGHCDKAYTLETFRRVYTNVIKPSRRMDLWPEVEDEFQVIPPPEKEKRHGRKTKTRRKEAEELEAIAEANRTKKLSKAGSTITCSICGSTGYSKRYHQREGCSSNIVAADIVKLDPQAPPLSQQSQVLILDLLYCI